MSTPDFVMASVVTLAVVLWAWLIALYVAEPFAKTSVGRWFGRIFAWLTRIFDRKAAASLHDHRDGASCHTCTTYNRD